MLICALSYELQYVGGNSIKPELVKCFRKTSCRFLNLLQVAEESE